MKPQFEYEPDKESKNATLGLFVIITVFVIVVTVITMGAIHLYNQI